MDRSAASATTSSAALISHDLLVLQREATLSIISECNLLVDARVLTNRLFVARCNPLREKMVSAERTRSAESNAANRSATGKGSG